ncbi:MAG: APC family permease [Methanomassiliicoccales archaeon]
MSSSSDTGAVFARKSSGLSRPYTAFDLVVFVIAFTIGSGILFFTVQVVGEYPGSNPFLALLVDIIPLFSGAAVVYLLATAMPRVGGQYVWISRLLNPGIGYFVNIFSWIGYCLIMGDVAYIGASFLAQGFTIAGLVTHSSTLSSSGQFFTHPLNIILVASLITIIFTILTFFGHTVSRVVVSVLFFIPLVILLVADIKMLLTPQSSVPSLWNAVFGSGSYNNIYSLSTSKGWTAKLIQPSLSATFLAAIPLISSWSGFSHFGGWISGETKVPNKTMFFGTIGAGLVALFLMAFTIGSYQHMYGVEFVSRMSYVSSSLHVTPSIPLLGAVAFGNVGWFAIVISFIVFLFPIKDVFPSIIFQARQLFGAAFDRMLPMRLLYVSRKTGQPIISYLVTGIAIIISIVVVSPYLKLGLFVGADLYVLSIGMLQLFTAIAAIVLPVTNPDLFEKAGRPANAEIGGIPVISLVGVLSLASWVYLLGDSFFNAFSAKVGLTVMLVISIIVGLIFLMYIAFMRRLAREGINVSLVGREIPPL